METIKYLVIDLESSSYSHKSLEIDYPYGENLWLKHKGDLDEFDENNPIIITKGYIGGQSLLGNGSIYFTTYDKEENKLVTESLNDTVSSKFSAFKNNAIVFINRARVPSFINIEENNISFLSSAFSKDKNLSEIQEMSNFNNGLIVNSPLASSVNRFAVLSTAESTFGAYGLSQVFYNKNIKAITISLSSKIITFDKVVNEGIKKKFKNSKFIDNQQNKSALFIIKELEKKKILGVDANRKGFDPRSYHLNEKEASAYRSDFQSRLLKQVTQQHASLNNIVSISKIYDLLHVTTNINNFEFPLADLILTKCEELGLAPAIVTLLYSLNYLDTIFNSMLPITKENMVEKLDYLSKHKYILEDLYTELKDREESLFINHQIAFPIDIRRANMTCLNQMTRVCPYSLYEIYVANRELSVSESAFWLYTEEYLVSLARILGCSEMLLIPLVYESINFHGLIRFKWFTNHLLKNRRSFRKFLKIDFFKTILKSIKKEEFTTFEINRIRRIISQNLGYNPIGSPYRYSMVVSACDDDIVLINANKLKYEYKRTFRLDDNYQQN